MIAFATFLAQHEIMLLAVVVATGLLLGRRRLGGMQLGPAGVLFAGIGLAAICRPYAPLALPASIRELGLVIFVYCVGLGSAAGFFRAFRRRGARWSLIVVLALVLAAAIVLVAGSSLGLDRGRLAGVFCGALTNTPALAAATDRLQGTPLVQQPALGYSATYPVGILVGLLVFRGFARRWRARSPRLAEPPPALASQDFEVTNESICGKRLDELRVRDEVGVVISRLHRGAGPTIVPTGATTLEHGDVVVAVGTRDALARAQSLFGTASVRRVEAHREDVDMRRILVSRRELAGRALGELELATRFSAQVTRLRRSDIDVLPSPAMRLELGDRLRVVAPVASLAAVARFFGDSERALADTDFVALGVGLGAGLLLGQLPLWPGSELKLGIAGPLIVSLILGRAARTASLVWQLPHEANQVLREFGLLVFLACVGIGAGGQLGPLLGRDGLVLFGLGALIATTTNLFVLAMLMWIGGATPAEALGACSGAHTQPAMLAAAYDMTERSEDTYVAYAVVYPAAMIGKILLAQLIVLLG